VTGRNGALPLLGLLALLVATPAAAQKKPLAPGERVDLNAATAAELMRLPGVGKKKAEAILASRDKRPFRKPEDVLRVKGMLSAGEAPAAQRPPETGRAAKGG
jgi:competence ComEA-like helix-hairpin-helix protein